MARKKTESEEQVSAMVGSRNADEEDRDKSRPLLEETKGVERRQVADSYWSGFGITTWCMGPEKREGGERVFLLIRRDIGRVICVGGYH